MRLWHFENLSDKQDKELREAWDKRDFVTMRKIIRENGVFRYCGTCSLTDLKIALALEQYYGST